MDMEGTFMTAKYLKSFPIAWSKNFKLPLTVTESRAINISHVPYERCQKHIRQKEKLFFIDTIYFQSVQMKIYVRHFPPCTQ